MKTQKTTQLNQSPAYLTKGFTYTQRIY